ncbi:MAG: aminodeoxychorismate/anthranilate synthase component II [Opitutales bacterium TMED158]|nr:MAG: aminodeoxychorismate/anthranilate synthase component II [Opitutales bacterium TMED158]
MILLIDNYDSFTYNLYQYLLMLDREVKVVRNDALRLDELADSKPEMIVISPGPGGPESTGQCGEVIEAFMGRVPLLGICLGMQTLAHCLGGMVTRAKEPVHGKNSSIQHCQSGLFEGLPSPLSVTRYHSLVVDRASLPEELGIDAETDSGEIMGLSHRSLPIWGVQFHPEAILTERGLALLENAVSLADRWRLSQ